MNVQELIDELLKVEDKSREVLHIEEEYSEVNYVVEYENNYYGKVILLSRTEEIGC